VAADAARAAPLNSNVRPQNEYRERSVSPLPAEAELRRRHAGSSRQLAVGWRNDCYGVIHDGLESVQTVQGEDFYYWVEFDVPQHDLSDGGPYYKAPNTQLLPYQCGLTHC